MTSNDNKIKVYRDVFVPKGTEYVKLNKGTAAQMAAKEK